MTESPHLWACSNFKHEHGFFQYPLDIKEGDRTTTCPKCGREDVLYMQNIISLIKNAKKKAGEIDV